MSHFLTNSGTTKFGLEHMEEVRRNTISKWDSLGFLDGVTGKTKQNIAELYDGKASAMLNESEVK